jgi:predicted nicotinamide N-methyase
VNYELKQTTEKFLGSHGRETELVISSLMDLERTIDTMFVELERRGKAEILAELCPYFGCVWPGARALATRVLDHPNLKQQKVLEIGCGLAIPGILAARAGADVTVTDCHPDVPIFLERNLALNAVQGVNFLHADWRSGWTLPSPTYDWIMGSDVLYDKEHAPTLTRWLGVPGQRTSRVTITDPGRPYLQEFVTGMVRAGWTESTTVVRVHDRAGFKDVFAIFFS